MPGRHLTDQQMRLFMTFRQTHSTPVAAAKAGISQAAKKLDQMAKSCKRKSQWQVIWGM